MKLRVHIDRLVLDGYSLTAAETRVVKAAMERELARLLAREGVGQELRARAAVADVRGGAFQPASGEPPPRLGERIARSVHAGIGAAP